MRLAVLLGVLAVVPVASQDASTIRVTTRLVQVNVIVSDKNGPVANLKREDFTLFDGKKARDIATFSISTAPPKSAAAPRPTPEATRIAKTPPTEFSNRIDERAAPSGVTVILLDSLNTMTADHAYARDQVQKLLASLGRNERIAVYALGAKLWVLQDFTTDFERIRMALAEAKLSSANPLEGAGEGVRQGTAESGTFGAVFAAADAFLSSSENQMAMFNSLNRATTTRAAMQAIVKHLAKIPGRKSLIWIAGNFPLGLTPSNSRDANTDPTIRLRSTGQVRMLNEANIAVYPVDARGLVGVNIAFKAEEAPLDGMLTKRADFVRNGRPPVNMQGSIHPDGRDVMQALAGLTGGRASFGSNDIAGSIQKAIDDSDVTYTLGFYPDANELDGKFHDLKVKVNRSGVDVRARKGYVAAEEAPLTPESLSSRVQHAASGPLELTEIAVTAKLERVDASAVRFALNIDVRDIAVENKSGKWVGALELFIVQRNKAAQLSNTDDVAGISATDDRLKVLREKGLELAKTVTTEPGVQEYRVIVLDRTSGRIGTVRIPASP